MTDALRRAERYRNVIVVLVLMTWPFDRHTPRVCREVPDVIIPGSATATRRQTKSSLDELVVGELVVDKLADEIAVDAHRV